MKTKRAESMAKLRASRKQSGLINWRVDVTPAELEELKYLLKQLRGPKHG